MRRWMWVAIIVAALATGYVAGYFVQTPPAAQMGMAVAGVPMAPPVKGYAEGETIYFLHTEASDPEVAKMLTEMMGDSPVLLVPELAEAPEALVAPVYVFTNGVKGDGPFGFQPDVFPAPPGTEGYRPLRSVLLVSWRDEGAARELRAAAEVKAAEQAGEVAVERPGVVVNMPMMTWPGGQR